MRQANDGINLKKNKKKYNVRDNRTKQNLTKILAF